ncbi:hypothetical protein BofuT4_uP153740.1 [Botrytis cinerea T4]|uniref:Uncharacterized protein n=1 Tax=Botryotinia fuckeliana (strain T4) TaxID=999810 RepID=G2YW14_BOTF4|nr:hypothetical protein BofuT4_uP153740.1 [Botrytis cinerea T4]
MMAPDLLPSMQACGMWLCTGVELTLVALVFTFFIYHRVPRMLEQAQVAEYITR